jgi:hypothetical protein
MQLTLFKHENKNHAEIMRSTESFRLSVRQSRCGVVKAAKQGSTCEKACQKKFQIALLLIKQHL